MRRRTFLTSTVAAAALPLMAQARTAAYDPAPQMVPVKAQYAPGQLLIPVSYTHLTLPTIYSV